MRWTFACAVMLCAVAAFAADDKPLTFTFGKDDVDKLPAGWKADQTGKGKGSEWKVVADKTAPSKSGHALAQVAKGPSALFNLCVAEKTKFTDGTVSVKLKAASGKIDQGGGVVWRYQDADNYYVCRYNPLEENFRVYKVVKGQRMQLGGKSDLDRKKDHWYALSISHKGDAITCSLDGKKLIEVKDDGIKAAGKVGLWSKADAVTHFDELTITSE
jgi:hypothetical protein